MEKKLTSQEAERILRKVDALPHFWFEMNGVVATSVALRLKSSFRYIPPSSEDGGACQEFAEDLKKAIVELVPEAEVFFVEKSIEEIGEVVEDDLNHPLKFADLDLVHQSGIALNQLALTFAIQMLSDVSGIPVQSLGEQFANLAHESLKKLTKEQLGECMQTVEDSLYSEPDAPPSFRALHLK